MTTSSDHLGVAAALAQAIADGAIWHGDRCNWIGMAPRDLSSAAGRTMGEALGPELYDGTAGVALFLAEAARALGDDRLARTARGALRHAFAHAGRLDGDGLYAGVPGIAYAAARVAAALDCDAALAGARAVLGAWSRGRVGATRWDVVGGSAGTASALLALAAGLDGARLLEQAVVAGDELLGAAERTPAGWLWPDPERASTHGLCGFSHGAAGIGTALLDLWAASGEARFRDAALGAFDYERGWFARRGGTWPDLRSIERRAGTDVPAPVSPAWCHGAPGIALSRLRALALLDSAPLRADAGAALTLTREHAAELYCGAPDDFSLCHGAAGAADVLLYGADRSGLAERIANVGIERYHQNTSAFPCGIPQGTTPGLMIGFAGIGLFYLRMHDPSVGTVLAIDQV